ncbi:glycosyl hydrolases family 28-domain-containing protein [Aspergillus spectabilis]
MYKLLGSAVLATFEIGVVASPADPLITASLSLAKRDSCIFSGQNGAASASASQASCATITLSDVAVPSGITLDLSDLEDGTTTPLLQIKGNSITTKGAEGARLNPDGSCWWDEEGSNGGKTKPKFFYAHDLTDSTIDSLYIDKTPVKAVSINGCDGLTDTVMTIDNSAGDDAGGHNTDGFDIGSSNNVTITRAKVYNQDDCVAIKSGTDITFSGGLCSVGLCSGGHGLSIGSVGGRDDNTVDTVTFEDSEITKSDNGIRIKAKSGEPGEIKGVTYSGITLSSINNVYFSGGEDYDDCQNVPSVASCSA